MDLAAFLDRCRRVDAPAGDGEWLRPGAPGRPIVVSSRVRLARNLAGRLFANRADAPERRRIVETVRGALAQTARGSALHWLDLDGAPREAARVLFERHLVSRELAEADGPRALAVDDDERLAVRVMEEDHLRLQAIAAGLALEPALDAALALESELEARLEFAFDRRWGYLTACPTNVGTGLRASVLIHLPALAMTGHAEKALRAVQELRLAVRGLYGEGTEATGELFQISNQATCGRDERTLVRDLDAVVRRIVAYEESARDRLLGDAGARGLRLRDRVARAWALLLSSRLMSTREMQGHLSSVRLGLALGLVPAEASEPLERLFLHGQSAHLQLALGEEVSSPERDRRRADLIRRTLAPWAATPLPDAAAGTADGCRPGSRP